MGKSRPVPIKSALVQLAVDSCVFFWSFKVQLAAVASWLCHNLRMLIGYGVHGGLGPIENAPYWMSARRMSKVSQVKSEKN